MQGLRHKLLPASQTFFYLPPLGKFGIFELPLVQVGRTVFQNAASACLQNVIRNPMTTEQALTDSPNPMPLMGQINLSVNRHPSQRFSIFIFSTAHFLKQFYADTHLAHLKVAQATARPKPSKEPNPPRTILISLFLTIINLKSI